jgi:hypothetical protein
MKQSLGHQINENEINGAYSIRRRQHECKITGKKREGRIPRRSEHCHNETSITKNGILK